MEIHIEGMKELNKKLIAIGQEMGSDTAMDAVRAGGHAMEAQIKINIRSQGLIDTGNLINSIQVRDVKESGQGAECTVGSAGVIYAAIHEFGGTILPKRAKMLSWISKRTGERIFAKSVTIPARPYIRPAVDEHKQDFIGAMEAAIIAKLGEFSE